MGALTAEAATRWTQTCRRCPVRVTGATTPSGRHLFVDAAPVYGGDVLLTELADGSLGAEGTTGRGDVEAYVKHACAGRPPAPSLDEAADAARAAERTV